MKNYTLFIDDGGVMNDNSLRGPQWQRLVSEFFVPRLGGAPSAWAQANFTVITEIMEPAVWKMRMEALPDYLSFDRTYQYDWLSRMCAIVGVPTPERDACIALADEATKLITRRVRSAFPGVVEAIRTLHASGYTLYTASAEPSYVLDGYLEGMDVLHCFTRLYGPDLIDMHKNGVEYYERIFTEVGIAPENALVIDDSPSALRWARRRERTPSTSHRRTRPPGMRNFI